MIVYLKINKYNYNNIKIINLYNKLIYINIIK